MENNNINQKKEFKVPSKFKPILIDLIKEILINKPEDILSFCIEYFKNKQEQLQTNLNRVTTYPILVNNKKNDNTNNKLNSFQKKFITHQKSNVKKDLVELSNDLYKNNLRLNNKDNNEEQIKETDEESYIFECINFDEKEKILSEIKAGDQKYPLKMQAERYYNSGFIPYKKYNDLLILAQKLIFTFYEKKGTKSEKDYINLEANFNKQIS